MKFTAAVLTELNMPLSIDDLETDEIQNGQVLVENHISGICGSQLHEIRGNKGNGKFLPHLMGHEGVGRVLAVGQGVTNVAVDDMVIMHWRVGTGIESNFPGYFYNGSKIGSGKVTTLSTHSVVSENRLTVVPPETNKEFAALLGCGLSTALAIVDNEIDFSLGEKVAVIGCGGVGLNIIQALKLAGAVVIGVDRELEKQALALTLGADKFLMNLDEDVDVVIDTTGNVEVISSYFSKCNKMVLVGQPEPSQSLVLEDAIKFFDGSGRSIRATQGGQFNPTKDIPRYLRLQDKINLDVITHRFNLKEVNTAFEILKSGKAGRIMIGMENE